MDPRLFQAATTGDISVFSDLNTSSISDDHFLTKTPELNNIIHVAVQKGQLKFIQEALKRFPALLNEKNADGNTPLHVAASRSNMDTVSFLIVRHQQNTTTTTTTTADDVEDEDDSWILNKNLQGDTPVHAALRSRNIEAAATFLRECAQDQLVRLFHICNSDGHTPLHLLALYCPVDDLVDEREDISMLYQDIFTCADDLRTERDSDGNTPLHLAIKSGNIFAAKVFIKRCLESEERHELGMGNNAGHSVFNLLASQAHLPGMKAKDLKEMMMLGKRLVKERTLLEEKMDDALYKVAVTAERKIFDNIRTRDGDMESGSVNFMDAYFLAQTPDGSNIIHIALQQGKEEGVTFIEEALNRYPSLLIQADCNGDTPLHLAAKLCNPVSRKLVTCFVDVYRRVKEQHKSGVLGLPWKAKNSKGNVPIHEALRTNNVFAALVLLHIDSNGASYVNDFGETALHLYARFGFTPAEGKDELLETLITQNTSAAYLRDWDGLTPLLRAAKCGRLRVVRAILEDCPQSACIRDADGRTFLHLLHFTGGDIDEHSADQLFKRMGKLLLKIPEADAQRLILDCEGNTPLHYAIKTDNSITAEILTWRCLETEDQTELMLVNNEGETVLSLLASHEASNEVAELIRKKHPSVKYSAMSSYGVHKAQIKDSAGSLSVIAALLATISFAAAYQVPGGFDSKGGFPVLIKKAAFRVFLLSDAIAMCSSTVVLFSLLWIMGSSKTFSSFVLIDISFFLLQASFYATLVTFMTGVYAATATEVLWLAIFVCALCSTVILITWKRSIIFLSKHIRLAIDMLITVKGFSFSRYIKYHG